VDIITQARLIETKSHPFSPVELSIYAQVELLGISNRIDNETYIGTTYPARLSNHFPPACLRDYPVPFVITKDFCRTYLSDWMAFNHQSRNLLRVSCNETLYMVASPLYLGLIPCFTLGGVRTNVYGDLEGNDVDTVLYNDGKPCVASYGNMLSALTDVVNYFNV
jgi:hypothetical protein